MKPHLVEIKDSETQKSIIVDMEGPYHPKEERIGEHMYGVTLYIDNVPYHFEKYIPTEEEIRKFKAENEGDVHYSKGNFFTASCRSRGNKKYDNHEPPRDPHGELFVSFIKKEN
jgi:hypothetical protein